MRVRVRVRLSLLPAQHSSLIQTLTQVPGIDHNTSLLEPAVANSRAASPNTNHGLFPLGCCNHSYTNHRLTPRRPHAGLYRESLARSLACTHTQKLTCEAAKGKTQNTQKTKNKMPDFYCYSPLLERSRANLHDSTKIADKNPATTPAAHNTTHYY